MKDDLEVKKLRPRIEGLLYGSLIGDAAGGPWEFSDPAPRPPVISLDDPLNDAALAALEGNFSLDPYQRKASVYGPWKDLAPAGTLSDDSRLKVMLLRAINLFQPLTSKSLAAYFLKKQHLGPYEEEWLEEFRHTARWIGGKKGGLPPERMWGGKPAIVGQMMLLPLAASYVGRREEIYRQAWELAIFDSGQAKDFTAATLVGLAEILRPEARHEDGLEAMIKTDPFGFGQTPFVDREVKRWMEAGIRMGRDARAVPRRLFEALEKELNAHSWWECWIPMTVSLACLEICRHRPLAAMELLLLFGRDTDSYLQWLGAWVGALHGKEIFHPDHLHLIDRTLKEDYGEKIEDWILVLGRGEEGGTAS